MNIRKKLSLTLSSTLLGFILLAGGTFAYFSDQVVTDNTFAAGTLDLSVDPEVIIDIDNLKPGDSMLREFVLTNKGSLNIQHVFLETDYHVIDVKGDNTEDFGKHILVKFLWNWDQESEPIFETTLHELKELDPDVVKRDLWDPLWKENSGLHVGETHEFWVEFEFVDNGEDQNEYQGDSLELVWKFNAMQGEGEEL